MESVDRGLAAFTVWSRLRRIAAHDPDKSVALITSITGAKNATPMSAQHMETDNDLLVAASLDGHVASTDLFGFLANG
jgi:hypothetical protein